MITEIREDQKVKKMSPTFSYCTLFDSGFAVAGIAMIDSFLKYSESSKMYILCMDNTIEEILNKRYSEKADGRIVLVPLENFMDDSIREIQQNRTWREFCWTCSAMIIRYIFEKYKELICTYVDADLYFFADPDELVEEMLQNNKSVQIVEHRFKMNASGRKQLKESGRFCVQFNSFVNDDQGNAVLNDWVNCVKAQCSEDAQKGLGDQYYLNEWPKKYTCVNILKQPGAGIAPWNINRYCVVIPQKATILQDGRISENEKTNERIYVSLDGKGCYLVYFYHFTHLTYLDENTANLGVFHRYFTLHKKSVYMLYIPYIKKLCDIARTEDKELYNKPLSKKRKEKIIIHDYWNKIICKIREVTNRNADFIDLRNLNRYQDYCVIDD